MGQPPGALTTKLPTGHVHLFYWKNNLRGSNAHVLRSIFNATSNQSSWIDNKCAESAWVTKKFFASIFLSSSLNPAHFSYKGILFVVVKDHILSLAFLFCSNDWGHGRIHPAEMCHRSVAQPQQVPAAEMNCDTSRAPLSLSSFWLSCNCFDSSPVNSVPADMGRTLSAGHSSAKERRKCRLSGGPIDYDLQTDCDSPRRP